MSVYLFYDKKSGEILHIHREVYMDSGKTVDLNPKQVLKEFRNLLPPKADVGILTLEKTPERQRGFDYFVDPGLKRVIKKEKPPRKKEAPK
jgi:hypothetical protein